jgi:hypothetical protein
MDATARSMSPRPILSTTNRRPSHDVEKGGKPANGDSAAATLTNKTVPPRSSTQENRDAVEETIKAKEGTNQVLRGVEEEVVTKVGLASLSFRNKGATMLTRTKSESLDVPYARWDGHLCPSSRPWFWGSHL